MKSRLQIKQGITIACALTLAACGGGSGTNSAGAGSSALSSGPISGFGSILQNGRRYIVDDNTQIIIDDNPGTSDLLEVGEFVVITSSGTDANGNPIATRVTQDTLLKATITAIDGTLQGFTALGQTVLVRDNTFVDPRFSAIGAVSDFERLEAGDGVEVSGFIDANGNLIATYVGFEDNVSEPRVTGDIQALDTDARTLQINDLLVDFNLASLDDMDGTPLANGLRVRIRGALNGERLDANEIKLVDDGFNSLDDDSEAEIKGVVTMVISTSAFEVNGTPVTTSAGTRFEGGTAATLAVGDIVEVEGRWSGDALAATEVEFEREDTVRIEAQIESLSATDATLNIGTITALGLTLSSDASTAYEDDSDADVANFGFDNLQVGDFVELRGYQDGATLVLTQVERDDAESPIEVELQGLLTQSTPNGALQILGVNVDVSSSEFEGSADQSLTAEEFFNAVTVDSTIVKVNGSYNGSLISADEVEIEEPEID